MLDDDARGRRRIEFLDALECGVGVGDVVVGEFLAAKLTGGGDRAGCCADLAIERGRLVRVFTITQVERFRELHGVRTRERLAPCGRTRRDLPSASWKWRRHRPRCVPVRVRP